MLSSAQLGILDGFCGPAHAAALAAFADAYREERALAVALEELRARAGARDRELDLLDWELAEIDQAAPSAAEEAELLAERERLRHAEALRGAVAGGLAALEGDVDAGAGSAVAALAAAARGVEALAGVDPGLDALGERLSALAVEADDVAAELRRYGEDVEAAPGRLDAVEERLALLDRLKRKHGGTVEAVLAYADACRQRRDELAGAEEALGEGQARLDAARSQLGAQAEALRASRVRAAAELADAVRARLADLAMEGATFEARVEPRADGAFGPTGGDEVEFLIAPNPGVPAGPLRETASGGELSRVMLALMSVAAESGDGDTGPSRPTLVFDEIDAGIGGQTARAVGERLRALAAGRQVVCITHLPQIASLADQHFRIAKDTAGETALTTVSALAKGELVAELVRMLGADADDVAARRHAKELLKAA
jgi:DNA repair protein RecN (Recombination protein N)